MTLMGKVMTFLTLRGGMVTRIYYIDGKRRRTMKEGDEWLSLFFFGGGRGACVRMHRRSAKEIMSNCPTQSFLYTGRRTE